MREEGMMSITFSYTDIFGQRSTLEKSFTSENLEFNTEFDLLVEQFQSFLLAAGFTKSHVESIIIKK